VAVQEPLLDWQKPMQGTDFKRTRNEMQLETDDPLDALNYATGGTSGTGTLGTGSTTQQQQLSLWYPKRKIQ
jgi:hypothetical protein